MIRRLFDRLVRFDDRSRDYRVVDKVDTTRMFTRAWECKTWLNQKSDCACVGFAIAHDLIAEPKKYKGIDATFAKEKIYWPAQKVDPWEGGSYPDAQPHYEGTSVLAGCKVAKESGFIGEYRWAFGIEDLIVGISNCGPAVLGLSWLTGMRETNEHGYINAYGKPEGGHCIFCKAVDMEMRRFTLHQSWGSIWGHRGDCYITFIDMDKLLKMKGEAVFLTKAK